MLHLRDHTQRMTDAAISAVKWEFAVVCLDDLVVFSCSAARTSIISGGKDLLLKIFKTIVNLSKYGSLDKMIKKSNGLLPFCFFERLILSDCANTLIFMTKIVKCRLNIA